MAGFQLAGPAADVSKILYGENCKSYQSPNAQYNTAGYTAVGATAVVGTVPTYVTRSTKFST
jgi:hypothetical protein